MLFRSRCQVAGRVLPGAYERVWHAPARDGPRCKSPAVCDLFPKPEHSDFKDGIDSYHRYDDDFSLFEEMGFTSYRFSIDWSRVCPDGINFSEESMQFYDDFIDSMIRHGMEPMCSLYHFEMPQLLMNKYNGFYSREVVDMFVTYANKMIDRYGDRVKKWISDRKSVV